MKNVYRQIRPHYLMRLCAVISLLLLLAAVDSGAASDPSANYPSRPFEYVVHNAPGAGTDILGRMICDIIQKEKFINQPAVVVNKQGGGGGMAMNYVFERKGNPYVLLNVSSGAYIITTLLEKLPYAITSFTPIANLAVDTGVLAVRSDSPFKTVNDLIAEAGRRPRELTMGLSSFLGTQSMAARTIQKRKGVQWSIISFKSEPEAILNLLGGHLDFTFTSPDDVLEHERAGKLRVLLANAPRRNPEFKNTPTIKEAGLGEPILLYRGVMGTPNMPDYAVKKMESVFKKVSDSDRFRKHLKDSMIEPDWMSTVEYTKLINNLNSEWKQMLTDHDLMKKK